MCREFAATFGGHRKSKKQDGQIEAHFEGLRVAAEDHGRELWRFQKQRLRSCLFAFLTGVAVVDVLPNLCLGGNHHQSAVGFYGSSPSPCRTRDRGVLSPGCGVSPPQPEHFRAEAFLHSVGTLLLGMGRHLGLPGAVLLWRGLPCIRLIKHEVELPHQFFPRLFGRSTVNLLFRQAYLFHEPL